MSRKSTNLSPKSGNVTREDGSWINWPNEFLNNINEFNETKVSQSVTQIALNNNLPLSSLRDITVGNVSKVDAEYRVRADGSDNTSILRTALRGNYISGHVLTPGMGIRIPTFPTGSQTIEWGYFEYDGSLNPDNGITFKRNATQLVLNLYSDGTNQIGGGTGVPQTDWNVDKLDGNGPSGVDITVPNGYVYRMPFIYYGYGPISFMVGLRSANGVYRMIPIHEADVDEGTSINEPNLPLSCIVYNGGDSSTLDAFVGGRQISVSGPDKALEPRQVGWEVESKTVGETITPILTFQHKTGRENIRVRLKNFFFESDKDVYLYLYRNHTLSAGTTTYTTPSGYDSNETATEWNKDATAFTGGERFGGTRYIPVGTTGNASGATGSDLPNSVLIEGENWGVAGRTKSGAGNATISGYANVEEEW